MEHRISISPHRGALRWRLVIPVFLALVGAVLLVGCIYLPIPEHKVGPEKDFRDLLGKPDSRKPIRTGVTSRSEIVRLLGPPPFISDDGHSVGYVVNTEGSQWIWPLCFSADPAAEDCYAIRLTFDSREVLSDWSVAHMFEQYGFYPVHPGIGREVIDKLNSTGPHLHRSKRIDAYEFELSGEHAVTPAPS